MARAATPSSLRALARCTGHLEAAKHKLTESYHLPKPLKASTWQDSKDRRWLELWLPWISANCAGDLLQAPIGSHRLPQAPIGSHRLP